MSKKVIEYDSLYSISVTGPEPQIGDRVVLQRLDQVGTDNWAVTSPVVAYDETMEIIETENTVYVPA